LSGGGRHHKATHVRLTPTTSTSHNLSPSIHSGWGVWGGAVGGGGKGDGRTSSKTGHEEGRRSLLHPPSAHPKKRVLMLDPSGGRG